MRIFDFELFTKHCSSRDHVLSVDPFSTKTISSVIFMLGISSFKVLLIIPAALWQGITIEITGAKLVNG